jgi:hypothetical protein
MIYKFSEYLKEATQIRVLDVVIDELGNLYSGEFGLPLIKGHIAPLEKEIIGTDNKKYIAGLDRSGKLFSFNMDSDGYVVNSNGERLLIPQEVLDRYNIPNSVRHWKEGREMIYSKILPILSTGWVNIKVDMEAFKKVKRYSSGLGDDLDSRLLSLSKDVLSRNRTTQTIQRELSAIMLLHYLSEVKNHFDPSSSGFLFESFMSGLIPNSIIKEDNQKVDIEDDSGNKYQLKLVDYASQTITLLKNPQDVDFYIIGLKYPTMIKIIVLTTEDDNYENYYGEFMVKSGTNKLSIPALRAVTGDDFVYELRLDNIDKRIDNIAKGLNSALDKLYAELSEFQYNVETVITGVDKNCVILEEDDFDRITKDSGRNLRQMREELNRLVGTIRRK